MRYANVALAIACAAVAASPAVARRALVAVDARSMPWDPAVNPKRAFGQGDGRRPVYVWGLKLVPEIRLLFTASGMISVLPEAPKRPPGGKGYRSAADVPGGLNGDFQAFPPIGSMSESLGRGRIAGQGARQGGGQDPLQVVGPRPIAQTGTWGPAGQPFRPADRSVGALGTVFPSYYMPARSYPVRVNALLGAFVDADGVVVGDPFVIADHVVATVPKGAAAIALGVNAESFAFNRGVIDVVIDTRTPIVTVESVAVP